MKNGSFDDFSGNFTGTLGTRHIVCFLSWEHPSPAFGDCSHCHRNQARQGPVDMNSLKDGDGMNG